MAAGLTDGALPFAVVASDGVTSDNAGGRDHWVAVAPPSGCDEAGWVARVAAERAAAAAAARAAAAAAAADAAAARASRHASATASARALRRRQARHVLYTAPEQAVAGAELTLHYRPHDTPLGPDPPGGVWVTAGFNGWAHPRTVGPVAMTPPSSSSSSSPSSSSSSSATHWTASLAVPPTAWCVDAVFSAGKPGAEGAGPVDNAGGFDYTFPTSASSIAAPPLHIVHVAVEMAPIAKVGGLADVVTALGRASAADGHAVEVVLPRYAFFSHSPLLGGDAMRLEFEFDHAGTHVWVVGATVEGLPVKFLEPANGLFSSDGSVYTSPSADQGRFAWFCGAAAAYLACRPGPSPSIVHAHDWSTAPIARILAHEWQGGGHGGGGHGGGGGHSPSPKKPPAVIFTIHNAEFGVPALGDAAHHAARVTTVSPSYAHDLRASPAFSPHAGKLVGILNGIDPDIWDPSSDSSLPLPYDAGTAEAGKAAARSALRARLGLTGWEDKPLCVVVSRLTAQKGIGLIEAAAHTAMARGGQFALLGSAPDPRVAAHFNGLASRLGGENAAFVFGFDEPLSRLMYAAADFVLVPSLFEPCGLTQLVGMRYGAVPVVRSTGGLADSVFDCDYGRGKAAWEVAGSADAEGDGAGCTNGFSFEGTDAGAVDSALHRALDTFYGVDGDRSSFRALQARVMRQDWSWCVLGMERRRASEKRGGRKRGGSGGVGVGGSPSSLHSIINSRAPPPPPPLPSPFTFTTQGPPRPGLREAVPPRGPALREREGREKGERREREGRKNLSGSVCFPREVRCVEAWVVGGGGRLPFVVSNFSHLFGSQRTTTQQSQYLRPARARMKKKGGGGGKVSPPRPSCRHDKKKVSCSLRQPPHTTPNHTHTGTREPRATHAQPGFRPSILHTRTKTAGPQAINNEGEEEKEGEGKKVGVS